MCGRYTLAVPASELVESFDLSGPDFDFSPRYNIAPGQAAPVVAQDRHGRRLGLLGWGLIPEWRDEPGRPLINARSESVMVKASFRDAFARRRCLVPADGFYEWKREGGEKAPFWIRPEAGGIVTFAGIWSSWRREGEESHHTFAILTMAAAGPVADVHDRMPVVIDAQDRGQWLDRHSDARRAFAVLRGGAVPKYSLVAVSKRVNRPDQDDAELIRPVAS